mmetsp:Transcript_23782/g.42767  ORF Transcript_23782/g.42767 Transcript_23782/m.42767 type:complete len:478 (-) Transcript_23782:75-1508(-)
MPGIGHFEPDVRITAPHCQRHLAVFGPFDRVQRVTNDICDHLFDAQAVGAEHKRHLRCIDVKACRARLYTCRQQAGCVLDGVGKVELLKAVPPLARKELKLSGDVFHPGDQPLHLVIQGGRTLGHFRGGKLVAHRRDRLTQLVRDRRGQLPQRCQPAGPLQLGLCFLQPAFGVPPFVDFHGKAFIGLTQGRLFALGRDKRRSDAAQTVQLHAAETQQHEGQKRPCGQPCPRGRRLIGDKEMQRPVVRQIRCAEVQQLLVVKAGRLALRVHIPIERVQRFGPKLPRGDDPVALTGGDGGQSFVPPIRIRGQEGDTIPIGQNDPFARGLPVFLQARQVNLDCNDACCVSLGRAHRHGVEVAGNACGRPDPVEFSQFTPLSGLKIGPVGIVLPLEAVWALRVGRGNSQPRVVHQIDRIEARTLCDACQSLIDRLWPRTGGCIDNDRIEGQQKRQVGEMAQFGFKRAAIQGQARSRFFDFL